MIEFNCNSTQHLSVLFFGGTLKSEYYDSWLDDNGEFVVYKTGVNKGQVKFKKVIKDQQFKGLGLKPLEEWETKNKGFYQTNEAILELIAKKDNDAGLIAKKILSIRNLQKQISTYYDSTEQLIYDIDECVHPKFHHVKTDTSRLAGSDPNIQNQPKASENEVREHFVSRFNGGNLLELDYSQLEICVQAQLSGDQQYIQDIIDGIDFHTKRLAVKEKLPYEEVNQKIKEQKDITWMGKRTQIKAFSFSRAYGAGVNRIMELTNMGREEVKALIRLEDELYSTLSNYYKQLDNHVMLKGWYKSPFNRLYKFNKEITPKWLHEQGVYETYSPTKIKNYIIQGTASDLLALMLGKFFREKAIHERNKYLLVATIHDSVVLDVRNKLDRSEIKNFFENVQQEFYNTFNYDWKVPIKCDLKIGTNWMMR